MVCKTNRTLSRSTHIQTFLDTFNILDQDYMLVIIHLLPENLYLFLIFFQKSKIVELLEIFKYNFALFYLIHLD